METALHHFQLDRTGTRFIDVIDKAWRGIGNSHDGVWTP